MRFSKLRSFLLTAVCVVLLAIAPNFYAAAQTPYSRTNSSLYTQYSPGQQSYQIFGEAGRSGSNGRSGSPGAVQSSTEIKIDDSRKSPILYDLSGAKGEDGTSGTAGEPARSCRVSYRPPYSLQGAVGGNGGSGGDGGNGSNGKSASIYYTDPAALKQVVIEADGGLGGQAGQGAGGKEGCECVEPEWVVNFCEWALYSRRTDIENAEWIFNSKEVAPCSGVKDVDERENTPPLPHTIQPNTAYQWVYQGITSTERFNCRDGEKGTDGQNGKLGQSGQYGEFRLIPRTEIPQEIVQRRGELKALIGQTVQFAKNIWVEKQDLPAQINSSSNVPDNYTYLQSTERPQFRLEWAAAVPPERLGVASTEIGVAVDASSGQAKIALDIPGTLDYTQSVKNGVEVATVTGGFSPSRVRSFRIESVTSSSGKSQLVVIDEGDLRGLISQSTIEVTLLTKRSASGLETPDYQRRNSVEFVVSPNSTGLLNNNIKIEGNVYTLNVGSSFGTWLKPDYEAQYIVNIQQTTHSGAVYSQSENVEFQVGSANT